MRQHDFSNDVAMYEVSYSTECAFYNPPYYKKGSLTAFLYKQLTIEAP